MNILTLKTAAVFVASAMLCIAAPAPSFAQDRAGGTPGDISQLLKQADSQLSELEQAVQSIEQSGVVTAETLATYGDVLAAYGDTMHNATDGALKAAALAAETKGKSGSVRSLEAFEHVAKDHERRTAALQSHLAKVVDHISGGGIKTVGFGSDLRAVFESLNKPIVAPAQAALAIPALVPCIAQNWVACAIAVAKAIPQAVSAWNAYQSCLANSPAVPTKPSPPASKPWYTYPARWTAYQAQLAIYNIKLAAYNNHRTICVVTFVAKIA